MAEASAVVLSPIQEISDIDLSFLLSQLSSVSGEITEKTLEELLKDAESQPPSLSWCIGRNLKSKSQELSKENQEIIDEQTKIKQVVSNSNLFKSAIDTLSEITNMVQEKLSIEEETKKKNVPAEQRPTYRSNKIAPAKSQNQENKVIRPACQIAKPLLKNVSARTTARPKVDTRWTSRSSIYSADQSVKVATKKSVNKIASRQSTMNAAMKLYGQPRIIERKPLRIKEVDRRKNERTSTKCALYSAETTAARGPSSSSTGMQCAATTVGEVEVMTSRSLSSANSNGYVIGASGDSIRELWLENARLDLQIKKIKAQLSRQESGATLPSKTRTAKAVQTESTGAIQPSDVLPAVQQSSGSNQNLAQPLSLQLRYFEDQLAAIREKYEHQLDSLSKKCEELERNREDTSYPVATKSGSVHTANQNDFCVQTDINLNETGSITTRIDTKKSENGGPPSNNVPENEVQKAAINFDDLVLDHDFQPWAQGNDDVPEKLPRLNFNQKDDRRKKKTSLASNVGISSGEHRILLSTIRSLQTELDTAKKVIQRLRSQQASNKARATERAKCCVRRTVGTQTIGLAACNASPYNPALFQVSKRMCNENYALKENIKILDEEIKTLKEKRLLDLRLLQEKHEVEIEVLLEEKLALSKKLDAVQSWRPW